MRSAQIGSVPNSRPTRDGEAFRTAHNWTKKAKTGPIRVAAPN